MYYFYILESQVNNKLYRGVTEDLRKRFKEHNSGKVKSTKPYCPWTLVYYEAHRNKVLARKAEIFYKTSQGRRQLKKKLGVRLKIRPERKGARVVERDGLENR